MVGSGVLVSYTLYLREQTAEATRAHRVLSWSNCYQTCVVIADQAGCCGWLPRLPWRGWVSQVVCWMSP